MVITLLLFALPGCARDKTNSDVKDVATQAMREQAEQSKRIADATDSLVAADAKARNELIVAHAKLQEQLQVERNNIDEQRGRLDDQKVQLDQLRESIEADRRRAPVIAESIRGVGAVVACLIPLLLAGYVLYSVNRVSDADASDLVNEVLIGELTSDTPRLLPPPVSPADHDVRLVDQSSSESDSPEPPF